MMHGKTRGANGDTEGPQLSGCSDYFCMLAWNVVSKTAAKVSIDGALPSPCCLRLSARASRHAAIAALRASLQRCASARLSTSPAAAAMRWPVLLRRARSSWCSRLSSLAACPSAFRAASVPACHNASSYVSGQPTPEARKLTLQHMHAEYSGLGIPV